MICIIDENSTGLKVVQDLEELRVVSESMGMIHLIQLSSYSSMRPKKKKKSNRVEKLSKEI